MGRRPGYVERRGGFSWYEDSCFAGTYVETTSPALNSDRYLSTDDSGSSLVHCRRLCLVSGIFVFKCLGGLWGREAENATPYQYRQALILDSELIRPGRSPGA